MNVSKATAEVYHLREAGTHKTWADIYIHETSEKSGALLIRSDFGSWDYYWGACGHGFKKFLIGLNDSYFSEKLMYGRSYEFYPDVWFKELRQHLDELQLDPEEYGECIDELEKTDEQGFRTIEAVTSYIYNNCDTLYSAVEDWPDSEHLPLRLTHFLEIWHEFQQLLKEELKEGKEAQQ
jgi:hypothetical protein